MPNKLPRLPIKETSTLTPPSTGDRQTKVVLPPKPLVMVGTALNE